MSMRRRSCFISNRIRFPRWSAAGLCRVDTSRTHPISGEVYAVYMPHEGVALKRLFLDGDHDRFILRTEQPAHPGVALLPQDCPGRILGRVSWVLQNV